MHTLVSANELFDAASVYPWMPGPAASVGVLALAICRRMIRTWIRLILAVVVAVAVGFGIALGVAWVVAGATEGSTNCACVVDIPGIFR